MELRFYAPQALGAQSIIRDALTTEMEKPKQENRLAANTSSEVVSAQKALAVEVAGVSFSYTDRGVTDPVLRDISLTIEPGQTVAFIGPSGAGKSTLVDLILGLHEPSSGQILCDGVPPKEYRAAKPGVIGYVPQKPGLVSGSVRENVALGLRPKEVDEEALVQALEQAEIAEFVDSLPQGVDSSLGHHVDSLSGGQIQRIGLARALYTKPRLLVLDEATSALDAEIEASITSSFKKP
jgi:ABC-type bacteriocin/lantibiotic exporters, contain an N-terminal double-glycine peptidase domain